MRTRDDAKQEALFNATVKVVNEIGFASSSVAKIAGEAGVSPATIYVYYKNKEDLLVSTYVRIKQRLSERVLEDLDDSLPIPDILKNVWMKMFAYINAHTDQFRFSEQFANSPYYNAVEKADVERFFAPLFDVVERGIALKMIKDVNFEILTIFMLQPIMSLASPRICQTIKLNQETLETAFELAWDAIKR